MELRDYQKECINIIESKPSGSYLIQMATGCGKTATFTNIPRRGKVLVLAHREELVTQPIKYFNCPVGVEMASQKSHGEEVVIASVQSLVRRLNKFKPDEFDTIIIDEAHHASASTYKKILAHFTPRLTLGFTATPNRNDNVRLDDVFKEIIFEKDIKWAIENKYLCNVECKRCNIGYDISKVAVRMGDFAPNELEKILNTDVLNQAVAEAYQKYARGATLIFATSVAHCEAIAKLITGAVAVTSNTKNRDEIIRKFTKKEIPCIVNCMIFTEGTDMPLVETIIIARPTSNSSLYTQMVGRGLRPHPDKDKLLLIDCVGTTGKANLCTAPTLIGLDARAVPQKMQEEIEGDLFSLPEIINDKMDTPEAWIKNVEIVNLWAKKQEYKLHDVNYFKFPNGDLVVNIPGKNYVIYHPDMTGYTVFEGEKMKMQKALDKLYNILNQHHPDSRHLWDLKIVKKWGTKPATEKQINLIKQRLKINIGEINKMEASMILNRIFGGSNGIQRRA